MAEVLGLVTSVMTLAAAVRGVCRGVRELHDMFGSLPGRLKTLGNEVADLEFILAHARRCLEDQQARDGDAAFGDFQQKMACLVKNLEDHIQNLGGVVGQIRDAGSESNFAPLQRGYAWKKHHGRLNELQENIVRDKSNLQVLTSTFIMSNSTRIYTDLRLLLAQSSSQHSEIMEIFSQHQKQQQRQNENKNDNDKDKDNKNEDQNHTQKVDSLIAQRVAYTIRMMQHNSDRLNATRRPGEVHPKVQAKRSAALEKAGKRVARSSPDDPQNQPDLDSFQMAVAARNSYCARSCPCRCHNTSRSEISGALSRMLGQLFVRHSGMPLLALSCDDQSCKRTDGPKVKLEYWFPMGCVWSTIVNFQASYQTTTGPSFQLRTLRRVPDSAAAVNYAISGNVQGLKTLFGKGLASPVDVSDTRGYSLLRWAVYAQQWDTVRFLYDAGADADYKPKAPSDNSPRNKASDLLLQGGLAPEAVDALTRMSRKEDWLEEQDLPMLHKIVIGISGKELLQELQDHPESVNDSDAMGRTALLWAAARGDAHAVTMLLVHDADPNTMDIQHAGPLSYAADRNHTVCARILLEAGADPDPVIPNGYRVGSPLNCAARNANNPLLIKTLLEFGAEVDACGVDQRTSLIHAARTDNTAFAQLLLEYGANINAMSGAGQTPLTTAITNNSHGVLRLLLDRWDQYADCPRLKGPNLLKITAQYADLETISILGETNHFRLKHDQKYAIGDFETLLMQRLDVDKKMYEGFMNLMAIIRREAELQKESHGSLVDQGLAFHESETLEEYTERIAQGGEPVPPPYMEREDPDPEYGLCPVAGVSRGASPSHDNQRDRVSLI